MKYTVSLLVASAAIASAQFTIGSNGSIACTGSNPNGVYCAGDSLSTNIIIRCTNGVGQAGNCNDNLAGYFPFGVRGAQCWSSAPDSGIGACAKNCLVQGGSGNSDTFRLPDCVPTYATTVTDTIEVSTSSSTATSLSTPIATTVTDTIEVSTPSSSATSLSTVTSTGTSICTTGGTTTTITFTTTYCPSDSLTTSIVAPTTTPHTPTAYSSTYVPTGGPTGSSNGTTTTKTSATPVGPSGTTSATPSTYTGGAMANSAGASFAAVGLFIVYFL